MEIILLTMIQRYRGFQYTYLADASSVIAISSSRIVKTNEDKELEVEVESTGAGFDAGVLVVDWLDDNGRFKRIEFLKKRGFTICFSTD